MKKLSLRVGGVLISLFLILTLNPSLAWAFTYVSGSGRGEGKCHLKWCFVPAPTILMPEQGEAVATPRPAIRALTWKTTIVKVFLDGVEMANVQQRKHEDYYGSVFAVPDFDLTEGEHFIYTIAYSEKPGWYDQSKESTYIRFTVKLSPKPKVVKYVAPKPTAPPEQAVPPTPTEAKETTDLPSELRAESRGKEEEQAEIDIISPAQEGGVEVEEGKIEGGVSIEAEKEPVSPPSFEVAALEPKLEEAGKQEPTSFQEAATFSELGEILEGEFVERDAEEIQRRNRIIGFSMLGVIIIILVVWAIASRQSIKREFKKEEKGELPPPPEPPEKIKKYEDKKSRNQASFAKAPEAEKIKKSPPEAGLPLAEKEEEVTIEPIKSEEYMLPPEALDEIGEEEDLFSVLSAEAPNISREAEAETPTEVGGIKEEERDYWASPPPSPYSPYPPSITEEEEDKSEQDKLI